MLIKVSMKISSLNNISIRITRSGSIRNSMEILSKIHLADTTSSTSTV